MTLTPSAYGWAAAAGICIGGAEIGYLYLLSGVGSSRGLPGHVIIATAVSATVLLTLIVARWVFREAVGWPQVLGGVLIVCGVLLLLLAKSGSGSETVESQIPKTASVLGGEPKSS